MINWTLRVEDVEDVACTVDDMEATDGSRCLIPKDGVREGWNEDSWFGGTSIQGLMGKTSQFRRRKLSGSIPVAV